MTEKRDKDLVSNRLKLSGQQDSNASPSTNELAAVSTGGQSCNPLLKDSLFHRIEK